MGSKKIIFLAASSLVLLALLAGGSLWAAGVWKPFSGGTADGVVWQERADLAQAELADSFWNESRGLYDNVSPCIAQLCTDPFNYWWQAHAVDVLVDGYERTGDERYEKLLERMYEGIAERNAGVYPNDYYDDMEWMGLAWLRAYDATQDKRYMDVARLLWEDVKTGWNEEQGGGIAWRKEQLDYKNTPANAPAVILAVRLYEHTKDQDDLDWAIRIYEWQKKTLVDPDSGFVWDGINRQGDGAVDKDWKFTYGQGVYIGAGVELYRVTGDEGYLADARKTADAAKEELTSSATGMLPSEGDGDGALFKGIFVRYLGELIQVDNEPKAWIELLETNAASLWDFGKDTEQARFSNSWAQTPENAVQLSTQLSAVMLLEQRARVEEREK
ncbi:glycoside hydrolase family 76 protein [Paenibacillus harenae]|uniref:Alpha-1,6-mannanase (GH76 family) n=1 Tax=Paenibacillus harenae TaxID=306543 RepID=A0ABT9UBH6_PAEHA|nr:glycoside hydrolase family 76 protein [Paenibacillus harenae]MDQ0116050.1 putative alpha-1,6-mannanase (GH76 family) [Paenibacillus harenae]